MIDTPAPVRRSPLAHRHSARGARWVDRLAEWPLEYGDRAAESRAARDGVALIDWGPLDKLHLRGVSLEAGVVGSGAAVGFPQGELWALHADEAILLLPAAAVSALTALRERGLVATDLSSGLAALRLVGPRSRRVLEELTQIDVSDGALPNGRVAFGPLANVQATIGRRDRDGVPGFTILVDRDLAEYVWDSLLEIGGAHGIIPAGCAVAA